MNTINSMFYIVLCIFANSTFLFSNINSYMFEFSKTTTNNGVVIDSVSGNLFSDQEKLYVDIQYPIEQKFISEFDKTIIYYPNDKRALSIPGPPTYFPFYNFLISSIVEDFGLSSRGFELDSTRIDDFEKLMTTHWSPPAYLSEDINGVKMKIRDSNIIQVDTYSNTGFLFSSVRFSEFISNNNYTMPSVIEIHGMRSKDDISIEVVKLVNLQLNNDISQFILDFTIPDDIIIENLEY